jgi:hypothetical protein
MAAALPHLDALVPGDDLDGLLAAISGQRADRG